MTEARQFDCRIVTDLRKTLLEEGRKEFAGKIVKHQVKKDVLKFNKETIEEMQKMLNVEKQNLEEIKEKTYKLQNDFCESVWEFSKKHDFGNFLVNYPRKKTPPLCNCEFFNETTEKIEKEIQENQEIQTLISEVTVLKRELEGFEKRKNLEEEINISNNLQYPSEEDNEIQRLTKVLQNSQQDLEFLEIEIKKYVQTEDDLLNNSEVKPKRTVQNDKKPSKKFKVMKETFHDSLSGPNTIDNYLILKKQNDVLLEEKTQNKEKEVINKSKVSNDVRQEQKSGILSSWTRNSNISFISTENSIQNRQTSENSKKDVLDDNIHKTEFTYFEKAEKSTSKESVFENKQTRLLVMPEQKSIPRGFTPKKQSTIAEKIWKKHNNY